MPFPSHPHLLKAVLAVKTFKVTQIVVVKNVLLCKLGQLGSDFVADCFVTNLFHKGMERAIPND